MDDAPNPPPRPPLNLRELLVTPDEAQAHRSKEPGPLETLFFGHDGRLANKWVHYLPLYDHVLAPYRHLPIRMLEIGVSHGGSLELWRKYFGPQAKLFGVDIDPACAKRFDPPNQVRIGSQADPAFLQGVVAEMGGVDIVLDDGSHVASHQRASFRTLWPLLSHGGIYVLEDLHTAYWPRWEGGLRQPGTGIELVKALIDDMHAWYHGQGESWARGDELGSILVVDSIVAIKKVLPRRPPVHVEIGHRQA